MTRWEWWKAPLSQIMTKSLNSFLSSGVIGLSWSVFRNVMRRYVLYGPIVGIWNRTTSLEMAAHMVMLAPLCPGTVKVALYPMRSLPHLLTLQRLKTWCAPQLQAKLQWKGLQLTLTAWCDKALLQYSGVSLPPPIGIWLSSKHHSSFEIELCRAASWP